MGCRRGVNSGWAVAAGIGAYALLGWAAPVAHAKLIMGLLAEPGPGVLGPMMIDPRPGTTYVFDVYAWVVGSDPSADKPEGLQSIAGSFRGAPPSSGFRIKYSSAGDLDPIGHSTLLAAVAPFNGPGATAGDVQASGTLGVDQDRDDPGGLVVFSASEMQLSGGAGDSWVPGARQFHIGRVELYISQVAGPQPPKIMFSPWRDPTGVVPESAASWMEDGQLMTPANGIIESHSVLLWVPEPCGLGMLGVLSCFLLARRR